MLNEYFLQSNELNALFNICELVTQMVKTLWNILYFEKELYVENCRMHMKQFFEFCEKRGIRI